MKNIKHWLIRTFPVLLKIYLIYFPSKSMTVNKKIKEILKFKSKYNLSSFLVVQDQVYFRSKLGAWFGYVPDWGAYNNEYGIVHEISEIEFVIANLKTKGVFLDIGANYGVFCLNILAKRKDVEAHAFEPVSKTFKYLTGNVSINNYESNIKLNNAAVGSVVGKAEISKDFHTNNQIVSTKSKNLDYEIVDTVTIDKYILNNKIKSVDFIKIDVEGFEMFVLQGGGNTLKEFKPILLLELFDGHLELFKTSKLEVIELLGKFGYQISQPVGFATNNYLFTHV